MGEPSEREFTDLERWDASTKRNIWIVWKLELEQNNYFFFLSVSRKSEYRLSDIKESLLIFSFLSGTAVLFLSDCLSFRYIRAETYGWKHMPSVICFKVMWREKERKSTNKIGLAPRFLVTDTLWELTFIFPTFVYVWDFSVTKALGSFKQKSKGPLFCFLRYCF